MKKYILWHDYGDDGEHIGHEMIEDDGGFLCQLSDSQDRWVKWEDVEKTLRKIQGYDCGLAITHATLCPIRYLVQQLFEQEQS